MPARGAKAMRASCQVFVDLAFQGRLRKSDELVGAEVFLFTQLLEEQGPAILDVPGYCVTVPVAERRARKSIGSRSCSRSWVCGPPFGWRCGSLTCSSCTITGGGSPNEH